MSSRSWSPNSLIPRKDRPTNLAPDLLLALNEAELDATPPPKPPRIVCRQHRCEAAASAASTLGKAGQVTSGPQGQSCRGPGGDSDHDTYGVVESILCLPPGTQTLLHRRGPARQGKSTGSCSPCGADPKCLAQAHECVEGTPPELPASSYLGWAAGGSESKSGFLRTSRSLGGRLCQDQPYLGGKEPNPGIEFKILLLSSGWLRSNINLGIPLPLSCCMPKKAVPMGRSLHPQHPLSPNLHTVGAASVASASS